jgi:acyl carrier protein
MCPTLFGIFISGSMGRGLLPLVDLGIYMTAPSELELAKLIVDTLNLSVAAESINPEDALFGTGLGLDSIDGLEVGVALKKQYNVTVAGADVNTAFHSIKTLQDFIAQKMSQAEVC